MNIRDNEKRIVRLVEPTENIYKENDDDDHMRGIMEVSQDDNEEEMSVIE